MDCDKVYYVTKNPKGKGLIFITELEKQELRELDLSLSSFLAVPTKSCFDSGCYPKKLKIKVYNKDHEEVVSLSRIGSDCYWAEIDVYTLIFQCGRRLGKYNGKMMPSYTLVALEPINEKSFVSACKERSIFFLGEVLKTQITNE